jgi:cobalt-zinc-cadmium efflux system membrane fusion protein
MKINFKNLEARLGRKQFLSVAAILGVGAVLAVLILTVGSRPSNKEGPAHKEAATEEHEQAGKENKSDAEHGGHESESLIALNDAQIKAAGIELKMAGPARIQTTLQLPGEIRFNEDRTAHIVPRLAGVVESVPANLGQLVKKGDVLAVIASTDLSERRSELLTAQKRLSLAQLTYEREKKLWQEKISAEQDYLQAQQVLREAEIAVTNAQQKLSALGTSLRGNGPLNRYEIRAPFDGMVIEKHISLGEAVKEDSSIFTVSDLSTVWAEIIVSAKDLDLIRVGERVKVKATSLESQADGTISFVGALLGQETRTAMARVTLANPKIAWRPGLFVNVDVATGETDAAVAVTNDSIQTINGKPTVFVHTEGGFKAHPVTLGRADGRMSEVVDGLAAGMPYATGNSYVLKAELGRSTIEDND